MGLHPATKTGPAGVRARCRRNLAVVDGHRARPGRAKRGFTVVPVAEMRTTDAGPTATKPSPSAAMMACTYGLATTRGGRRRVGCVRTLTDRPSRAIAATVAPAPGWSQRGAQPRCRHRRCPWPGGDQWGRQRCRRRHRRTSGRPCWLPGATARESDDEDGGRGGDDGTGGVAGRHADYLASRREWDFAVVVDATWLQTVVLERGPGTHGVSAHLVVGTPAHRVALFWTPMRGLRSPLSRNGHGAGRRVRSPGHLARRPRLVRGPAQQRCPREPTTVHRLGRHCRDDPIGIVGFRLQGI